MYALYNKRYERLTLYKVIKQLEPNELYSILMSKQQLQIDGLGEMTYFEKRCSDTW